MKRLKTRKNPQIQIHHAPGLDWTIHNPTDTRIPVIIVERMIDLKKSLSHNFGVMVLKPYLFSILNVLYRLKGIEITVFA
jgi:hypothetical protein